MPEIVLPYAEIGNSINFGHILDEAMHVSICNHRVNPSHLGQIVGLNFGIITNNND